MSRALHDKLDQIILGVTASEIGPLSKLISDFLDGLIAFQFPQEPQLVQIAPNSDCSRPALRPPQGPSDSPVQPSSSSELPPTSLSPLIADSAGRLITPEMIEAGVEALRPEFTLDCSYTAARHLAEDVIRRALAASPKRILSAAE